jgi:hypothetical protein
VDIPATIQHRAKVASGNHHIGLVRLNMLHREPTISCSTGANWWEMLRCTVCLYSSLASPSRTIYHDNWLWSCDTARAVTIHGKNYRPSDDALRHGSNERHRA